MLNICICDDDITHLRYTEKIINGYLVGRKIETESFISPKALLRQVNENSYLPDIAVLDIEMAEINGIELAKELNRLVPGCCIIFLTGHAGFCCDAYSAEHVFFVLKDRAKEYVGTALDKALASIDSRSVECVSFNVRGSTVVLPPDKIVYIESTLRKLIIHTPDNIFESYGKLDDLDHKAWSTYFVRCHQSYLVNLKYVVGIENSRFLLSTGDEISISRSRFQSSKAEFLSHTIS